MPELIYVHLHYSHLLDWNNRGKNGDTGTGREEPTTLFTDAVQAQTYAHIYYHTHSAPQPHRLTSHNEMLAPYAPALSKHSSTACCYLLASVEFTHLVLFYKIELTAICEISAEQMVTNHYFPFV